MPVTSYQGPIYFHKPATKDWGKKYDAIFRRDPKKSTVKSKIKKKVK